MSSAKNSPRLNETANQGERVLTLSAFRYYLRTDLFFLLHQNNEYNIFRNLTARDTEEFWLEVLRQGYEYIAYEKEYADGHVKLKITPDPDNAPEWIELVPIFGDPGDP